MAKKLPKFSGRSLEEKESKKINSNYQIKPHEKLEIPELQEEKKQQEKKQPDLYDKLKNLFDTKTKPVSKNIQNITNNYNKELMSILNNNIRLFKSSLVSNKKQNLSSSKTQNNNKVEKINSIPFDSQTIIPDTGSEKIENKNSYFKQKETSNIDNYNISPQNEKMISIMNSFIGRSPFAINSSMLKNNLTSSKSANFYVTRNKNNKIKNLSNFNKSASYGISNESNKSASYGISNESIENKINEITDFDLQKNKTDQFFQNSKSNSNLNSNSRTNITISKNEVISPSEQELITTTPELKSSVQRHPFFGKEKGVPYIYSADKKQKAISLAEGTSGALFTKPTTVAVAEKGAEVAKISPPDKNALSETAQKSVEQAINDTSKNEESKDNQKAIELEREASSPGAGSNNITVTNLSKTMTTFEKVAIETFMVPAWRRIFG